MSGIIDPRMAVELHQDCTQTLIFGKLNKPTTLNHLYKWYIDVVVVWCEGGAGTAVHTYWLSKREWSTPGPEPESGRCCEHRDDSGIRIITMLVISADHFGGPEGTYTFHCTTYILTCVNKILFDYVYIIMYTSIHNYLACIHNYSYRYT